MPLAEGVETYRQAVEERFSAFRDCINSLVVGFSNTDQNKRGQLVKNLMEKTRDLADILPNKGLPKWLTDIRGATTQANADLNDKHTEQLLRVIWQSRDQIQPIEFPSQDNSLFDFDELFNHYRDQGRIAELFDELVRALGSIIDSGVIDSLTAINALKDLIGMLKANRNGSLAAIKSCLFSAAYMKNTFIELLKEVPVLKAFVSGYEKTLQEAEHELGKIEEHLTEEIKNQLLEHNPNIAQLPALAAQGTLALPSPSVDAPSSEDKPEG